MSSVQAETSAQPLAAPRWHYSVVQTLLQLLPLIALFAVYAVAGPELARPSVGEVSEASLLVRIGTLLPWLSYAACLPLYTFLEPATLARTADRNAVLLAALPKLFSVAAFSAGLGSYIYGAYAAWSIPVILTVAASLFLHLLFCQLLAYFVQVRSWSRWLVGWAVYDSMFLWLPNCWVAPLAASGVLLIVVASSGASPLAATSPRLTAAALPFAKGLVLGLFLWLDKIALLIRFDAIDQVPMPLIANALIISTLSAFYFSRGAQVINAAVKRATADVELKPWPWFAIFDRSVRCAVARIWLEMLALLAMGFAIWRMIDDTAFTELDLPELLIANGVLLGIGVVAFYMILATDRGRFAYGVMSAYGTSGIFIATVAHEALWLTYGLVLLVGTTVTLLTAASIYDWWQASYTFFWRRADRTL